MKESEITTFVEWLVRNPELAEKHYPEIVEGLKNRIQSRPDFEGALIIQKLPTHFLKWKNESDNLFGLTKTKHAQEIIDLLQIILNAAGERSSLETEAVDSVRDELAEQLEYWQRVRSNHKSTSIKIELSPDWPLSKEFLKEFQQMNYNFNQFCIACFAVRWNPRAYKKGEHSNFKEVLKPVLLCAGLKGYVNDSAKLKKAVDEKPKTLVEITDWLDLTSEDLTRDYIESVAALLEKHELLVKNRLPLT